MIYILVENSNFFNEIQFVFEYIFKYVFNIKDSYEIGKYGDIVDVDKVKLIISYGMNRPKIGFNWCHIHIYESNLFSENFLTLKSFPQRPLKNYEDNDLQRVIGVDFLPILYEGCKKVAKHIKCTEDYIETDIDIVASAFFMMTGYEELVNPIRDEHNRFPGKESIAYKEGFLERPIINEYINLLEGWIYQLLPGFRFNKKFNKGECYFCLSHDIDHIKKYYNIKNYLSALKKGIKQSIKGRKLRGTSDILLELFGALLGKDPYYNFEELILLEEMFGIKSSWYIMTKKEHVLDGHIYYFDEVKLILEKLLKGGHEIGIHLSYNSYNDFVLVKNELDEFHKWSKLHPSQHGNRQHFLRFDVNATWQLHEKCNILYDSSFGFADHIGFRSGLCFPYQPYDFRERRALNLWEIPLIAMDGSFKTYMNLNVDQAWGKMLNLFNQIEQQGGILTFLWHNSSAGVEWVEWKNFYINVLKEVTTRNYIPLTGMEVCTLFNT